MEPLEEKLGAIFAHPIKKLVLSKPRTKDAPYRKIELQRKEAAFQAARYTEKQVFHETVSPDGAADYCARWLREGYLQLNAWSESQEFLLLLSKKGSATLKTKPLAPACAPKVTAGHNREKHYLLPEGTVVPPLVDMGVFTQEGKVVRTMYDKFRQINRFLELVDDAVREDPAQELRIIDFGCGKSYLTFVLYYYFTQIRKRQVHIVGLDLKADVIERCNEAARRYGYDRLHFQLGDINGYRSDEPVDMVITLHACDTATDYALYNAVCWNSRMIFSVPCCQHELNGQMESRDLSLLTRYGIIQERFAALTTDAIRGGLLEACGYQVQLLEFVDFAHTPKNILIRAIRRKGGPKRPQEDRAEVERLMAAFHLQPTLYTLLAERLSPSTEQETPQ